MKHFYTALALVALTPTQSIGQISFDTTKATICSAIENNKNRLACFDGLSAQIAVNKGQVKKWTHHELPDLINDSVRHVFLTKSNAPADRGKSIRQSMLLSLVCEKGRASWIVKLKSRPLHRPTGYVMRIDGGGATRDGIYSQNGRHVTLTIHPEKVSSILKQFITSKSVVIRIEGKDGRNEDGLFDTTSLPELEPKINKACGW